MTPSLKKRFWKEAKVVEVENGFGIQLDGRSLRTPSKAIFAVAHEEIARMTADEWMAQGDEVDPATMPATRMANSVIDKVSVNFDAIVEMLTEYAGSDLLCYRATTPQALIAEQARVWDPLLEWSATAFNAPFVTTSGVMYVTQPAQSVEMYRAILNAMNMYQLAGVHDLISISGSIVITMALITNHLDLNQAWQAVIVDDLWQERQWGADEEAQANLSVKFDDFKFAYKFWQASTA